jgi:hypothetical protein
MVEARLFPGRAADLFSAISARRTMRASLVRTDPRTEEHLEAVLQTRLGGRVRDLRVTLKDEGVVLNGRATTYYAKQLAQHVVMETAGMTVLANDIEVC